MLQSYQSQTPTKLLLINTKTLNYRGRLPGNAHSHLLARPQILNRTPVVNPQFKLQKRSIVDTRANQFETVMLCKNHIFNVVSSKRRSFLQRSLPKETPEGNYDLYSGTPVSSFSTWQGFQLLGTL